MKYIKIFENLNKNDFIIELNIYSFIFTIKIYFCLIYFFIEIIYKLFYI